MTQIDPPTAAVTNWTCSSLAIAILVIRALVSRHTVHVTAVSKWICAASVVVISARLSIIHFVLQAQHEDSTNPDNSNPKNTLDARTIGILTLTARGLATTYLWMQVALLLRFYARIVGHITWIKIAIQATWTFFIVSYATVMLATFLECRPIDMYWSDEARICQQAKTQIFTQGIFCIILDIVLLVIVVPVIYRARLELSRKIQILVLVFLGTFCMIVTGMRLAYVEDSRSSQVIRTFWAAIALVVSTFVANTPTIVGCLNLKRSLAAARGKEAVAEPCGSVEKAELKPYVMELEGAIHTYPSMSEADSCDFGAQVNRTGSAVSSVKMLATRDDKQRSQSIQRLFAEE